MRAGKEMSLNQVSWIKYHDTIEHDLLQWDRTLILRDMLQENRYHISVSDTKGWQQLWKRSIGATHQKANPHLLLQTAHKLLY